MRFLSFMFTPVNKKFSLWGFNNTYTPFYWKRNLILTLVFIDYIVRTKQCLIIYTGEFYESRVLRNHLVEIK